MSLLQFAIVDLPIERQVLLFFIVGSCLGTVLTLWIVVLTEEPNGPLSSAAAGRVDRSRWWHHLPLMGYFLSGGKRTFHGQPIAGWGIVVEVGTGLLFAGFVAAKVAGKCQEVTEVQPDELWQYGRIFYHLLLICFLVTAVGTDFRNYTIPDAITLSGIVAGLGGAVLAGDLQMIHLWVDWNDPYVDLHGPYIPEWLKEHRHFHGLSWSLAGLTCGAAVTWLVRAVSSWILGRESLGLGDVTLMAMIGSFVGWQPVIVIFFAAPLCGLIVGLGARVLIGQRYIPYGPFLSTAALIVLFSWRWIWTFEIPWSDRDVHSIKKLFGDPVGMGMILGAALTALVGLLGLMRLYQNIPVKQRESESSRNSSGE